VATYPNCGKFLKTYKKYRVKGTNGSLMIPPYCKIAIREGARGNRRFHLYSIFRVPNCKRKFAMAEIKTQVW
jgi:hypothetical protein